MFSASAVQAHSLVPRLIPLAQLAESPTNPRKYFDPKKLEELTASVKTEGIIQPLLAREVLGLEQLEIVCGARRYRAASAAGLSEVPVIVRELDDAQVFRIQIAENIDRDDLTPYEQAEAFGKLFEETKSVAEVAKIVKRRTSEVAARLALLTLPKKVKEVLASGVLPLGHAELIARIPDAKLQEIALGRILNDFSNEWESEKPVVAAVPYTIAKKIVEQEFMTSLATALFDPEAPDLSPLGPCSACPHLSANNRDLFGDVKGKNLCTNPADFRLKTENHLKQLRDAGYKVLLTKGEIRDAFPHYPPNPHAVSPKYVTLDQVCPDDPKGRCYEELLGKAEKLKTVFALVDGRVRKLYPRSDLAPALLASGHRFVKKTKRPVKKESAAQATERKISAAIAKALALEVAGKLRTAKLPTDRFADLLLKAVILSEGYKVKYVIGRHGYAGTEEEFAKNSERILAERVAAMSEVEKRAFALDLLVGDFHQAPSSKEQQAFHKDLVKVLGIDAVVLAKRVSDDMKRAAAEKSAPVKSRQVPITKSKGPAKSISAKTLRPKGRS